MVYSSLLSFGQCANRDVGNTELDELDDVDEALSEVVTLGISDVEAVEEDEVAPVLELAETSVEEEDEVGPPELEAFNTRIPESVFSSL